MMIRFFSLIYLLYSCFFSAQEKYYLLSDRTLNSKEYSKFKDSLKQKGTLVENETFSFKKNDSLFVVPKLEMTTENSTYFFQNIKEYFNQLLAKNNLLELKEIKENKEIDFSKPFFVNCWFTNCPPCVSEIPNLNALKEKYGNQINFLAITFDSKREN